MNVTIVQGAFLPVPPVAGGAVEKLWSDLGREFARRGLAVTHISRLWPGLPAAGSVDGVVHRRLGGFDYPRSRLLAKAMDLVYSLRCLWALKKLTAQKALAPPDIVVTNTFFLPLLLSWFARGGIVYVSVHRYPQGQMALYSRVGRLQCVSTAIADAVRAQTPAVAPLVKVVPNYVPTRLAEDEVAQTWPARRREVLFVGRVHPEKGIELLLRAFAAMAEGQRQGWVLRIVGPHLTAAGGGGLGFKEAMDKLAHSLGVAVDWAGPIYDRELLNQAYRQARVFVYPSVAARGEAFPLAPLEAMARGCPVVTSDLPCFADFIQPGINADVFAFDATQACAAANADAGNAQRLALQLQTLMGDETRQRRYSQAGLQTAQRFTLEHVADAFVADFTALHSKH